MLQMPTKKRLYLFIRHLLSIQLTFLSLFHSLDQFVPRLISPLYFSLPEHFQLRVSCLKCYSLIIQRRFRYNPRLLSPTLKTSVHVILSPSYHSGTKAAVENLLSSRHEPEGLQAEKDGTEIRGSYPTLTRNRTGSTGLICSITKLTICWSHLLRLEQY